MRASGSRRPHGGAGSFERKGLRHGTPPPSRDRKHGDRFLPHRNRGAAEATRPEIVELADGDSFDLEIAAVAKRIGDATVRMLAYNGSIPGPTLKLPQGSTVTVHVTNRGDLEATVHWHGLRLENRFDGTHDTQAPIPVGDLHLRSERS